MIIFIKQRFWDERISGTTGLSILPFFKEGTEYTYSDFFPTWEIAIPKKFYCLN